MSCTQENIYVFCEDDFDSTLTIKEEDENGILQNKDLTGWDVIFTVKRNLGDADDAPTTIQNTVTGNQGGTGESKMAYTKAQSYKEPGTFPFSVVLTNGITVETIKYGMLIFMLRS